MVKISGMTRCLLGFLLGACAWTFAATPSPNPSTPGFTGQIGVYIPPRTEDGNWDGTWYYDSVECKIAMWIRTKRGKPEVRVKYVSSRYPLSFESDWKGNASYYNAEQPAEFALRLDRATPGEMDGSWRWDARMQSASRNERGKFSMYRALDGRLLVMQFSEYELALIKPGKTVGTKKPPIWTFIKASKREALWDELPF